MRTVLYAPDGAAPGAADVVVRSFAELRAWPASERLAGRFRLRGANLDAAAWLAP